MATAKKHMERSHRSHRRKYDAFNAFNRKAYIRSVAKTNQQQNVSLVSMLKGALAPHRKTEGGM